MSWLVAFLVIFLPVPDDQRDAPYRSLYDSLPGDAMRQLWSR